ncbi:MAG: OB-fold domain-containing protein [Acidimicrobiales bacterium]|nr:OB-fold domain-containing protein [Acidimicrobiales bacterium]
MSPARAVPQPTPETAHFWEGTLAGELRLQRCTACQDTYFPPQPWCPRCGSADVDVVVASGSGRVLSAVVSHLPAPGLDPPVVLAVVGLDEGPQLLTNLAGVSPDLDTIPIGLAVQVEYEAVDGVALPRFRAVDHRESEAS